MGLVAIRTIKEPPDRWEVEVTAPAEWRGFFTSRDGENWASHELGRALGEHHNNPGEARMLGNLRALARGHKLGRLERVADAARHLLEVTQPSGAPEADGIVATAARERLAAALTELEPPRRFRPVSASYEQPLKVTPAAAGIEPPGYEPTEEVDEP